MLLDVFTRWRTSYRPHPLDAIAGAAEMTQPKPFSPRDLIRAVSTWLELGAAVDIMPDGTIKVHPQSVEKPHHIDLVDFKR